MTRRLIVGLVVAAGSLLLASLVAKWLIDTQPEAELRDLTAPPTLVELVLLQHEDITPTVEAFGTARALREQTIRAEVTGRITTLPDAVRPGRTVADGTTLVVIDPADPAQQLARVEAAILQETARLEQIGTEQGNLARIKAIALSELNIEARELDRLERLGQRDAANAREIDRQRSAVERIRRAVEEVEGQERLIQPRRQAAQAAIKALEAEQTMARTQLDRCTINTPFPASVTQRMVEPGEWVKPGDPLLHLIDLSRVEVALAVPAAARAELSLNSPVPLRPEGRPNDRLTGTLVRISAANDPAMRSFMAFIEIDNTAHAVPLLPGEFVRAELPGRPLDNVIAIDRSAMVDGACFVAVGNTARRRPVRVLRHVGERSIVEGLQPGDLLILSHLQTLRDGQLIRYDLPPTAPAQAADAPRSPPQTDPLASRSARQSSENAAP